jgi:hypothetical protein
MRRGQAHTLEAFAASVLVLSSLAFALGVTTVTPLTASTSSQHIENQQGATAEGVLAAARDAGTLKPTLLYWNESAGTHHDPDYQGAYTGPGDPPRTTLLATLDRAFLSRGVAANLNVYYLQNGNRRRHRVLRYGVPSDNAASATLTVTLLDRDRLYGPDGRRNGTDGRLDAASFYAPDASPEAGVYNVVVVEVVVWRM